MNVTDMTPTQIRQAGLQAVVRELGPLGLVRFLQQFETGAGDYSAERHQLLARCDVETLVEQIRQRRRAPAPGETPTST